MNIQELKVKNKDMSIDHNFKYDPPNKIFVYTFFQKKLSYNNLRDTLAYNKQVYQQQMNQINKNNNQIKVSNHNPKSINNHNISNSISSNKNKSSNKINFEQLKSKTNKNDIKSILFSPQNLKISEKYVNNVNNVDSNVVNMLGRTTSNFNYKKVSYKLMELVSGKNNNSSIRNKSYNNSNKIIKAKEDYFIDDNDNKLIKANNNDNINVNVNVNVKDNKGKANLKLQPLILSRSNSILSNEYLSNKNENLVLDSLNNSNSDIKSQDSKLITSRYQPIGLD